MRAAIFGAGVSGLIVAAAAVLVTAGTVTGDGGLLQVGIALSVLGAFVILGSFLLAVCTVFRA